MKVNEEDQTEKVKQFAALRQRAEQALADRGEEETQSYLAADARHLLVELQIHQVELEMQNDELRTAQVQVASEREMYADLYNFAPLAYFTLDDRDIILDLNLTAAELLNGERKYLIDHPITPYLTPDSLQTFIQHRQLALETRVPQICDLEIRRRDQTPMYVQARTVALPPENSNRQFWRSAMTDITSRKQAEAKLATSLAEKEVLLRELNHRSRNNMQVICSMLSIYANMLNNPQITQAFEDMINRIQSMALVYQELSQSQNLSRINLRPYICDLVSLLEQSFALPADKVHFVLDDVADVLVLIDVAIPCGLILNELISNALKHAFPGDRRGEVRISLSASEAGKIVLQVADNGIGLEPGFDFRSAGRMGLGIVYSITEQQLRGSVVASRQPGVGYQIQFENTLYQARV